MGFFDFFKKKNNQPKLDNFSGEDIVVTSLRKAINEPAYGAEFYKNLLSENLLVLVDKTKFPKGAQTLKKETEVTFLALQDGEIPVFTSNDRIFDKGIMQEDVLYLPMKGEALFKLTTGMSFVLNPYSDIGKVLLPGEIESLLKGTVLTDKSVRYGGIWTNNHQANLIFRDSLGHPLTKNELANYTGKGSYEIVSNQSVDPVAKILHNEARELGKSGKYDLAIAKLEQAINLEPAWAYPVYDLAYTYLLKGDFDNALKFYRKTDELEPKGFFTAKTALYSLEGEKSGKFPKGLYVVYSQIEWADDSDKLKIAKTMTEQVPDFAPAWKALAVLLNDPTEKLKAIEQGLSKNPDADTKGILLINKSHVLVAGEKQEEAKQLLDDLIFSPDATAANIELAKFTLTRITEK